MHSSQADIQSARNHLQNVLTVEWDNNKTVLVDVTGQNDPHRSDDVELSGLTAPGNRSEYGRLDDDEVCPLSSCHWNMDGREEESVLMPARTECSSSSPSEEMRRARATLVSLDRDVQSLHARFPGSRSD